MNARKPRASIRGKLHHYQNANTTLSKFLINAPRKNDSNISPPQRLPLGIPIKIAIIEKIESARGPIIPRAFFFFLPSLPKTQRGLCEGERV